MTRKYYREPKLKGCVRKCLFCDKTEVNETGWKEHWRRYQNGYLCEKHYNKLNFPQKKEYFYSKRREIQSRIIHFLYTDIILSFNPRKGYCSWCTNNIHDGSCELTSLHHWFYVRIMPWACTEEICNSCHMKYNRSLEKKS